MNKINRTLASFILAAAALSGTAYALTDEQKEDVSKGMNDFATSVTISVPDAATQQNVWADAYIGTVFPGAHFGAGITLAGTQLDMTGFKTAATTLCGDMEITLSENETLKKLNFDKVSITQIPDTFILPTATVDARIGGVFLPFDIGICAMATNPLFQMADYKDPNSWANVDRPIEWSILGFDGAVDYMALGADIRYCLYEGNLFLPAISLGGGYYYIRGSFAVSKTDTADLSAYGAGDQTTDVKMGLSYSSSVAFAQAQASYSFGLVNVFGGARGLVSKTTADWSWAYDTSNSNGSDDLKKSDSGSGSVETEDTLKSVYHDMTLDLSKIQPQVYLGLSGNFGIFQTSLSVTADCRSIKTALDYKDPSLFIWSGSLGTHLKF